MMKLPASPHSKYWGGLFLLLPDWGHATGTSAIDNKDFQMEAEAF